MRLLPLLFLAPLAFTIQPLSIAHRTQSGSARGTAQGPRMSGGGLGRVMTDANDPCSAWLTGREGGRVPQDEDEAAEDHARSSTCCAIKLGNENEKVWRPAFEELEDFDPRLAMDLETLMDRYKESPARKRMVEVMSGEGGRLVRGSGGRFGGAGTACSKSNLESFLRADHKIEGPQPIGCNPKKKWTRIVFAVIALLEHIGTPQAIAILRDMATGHPDAQPTEVARVLPRTPRKVRPRPLNRRALPIDLPGDRSWIAGFKSHSQSVKPGSWFYRTGGRGTMAGAGTGGLEAIVATRGRRRSDRHAQRSASSPHGALLVAAIAVGLARCRTSLTSFLPAPPGSFRSRTDSDT